MKRVMIMSPRRADKPTAQLDLFRNSAAQPESHAPSDKPEPAQASPTTRATLFSRPPIKYRDPATGQTWTGRGLRPKWLQARIDEGRQINEF